MIDNKIEKRYAEAIYQLSEERNQIKEVYDLLNSVMNFYITDNYFKDLITSPIISFNEKQNILKEIYSDVNENILEIIFYILEKNRIYSIKGIVAELLKIYYKKNRILDVKAVFARELTEEQKEKLISKLTKKTGKEINLNVIVDENIIGGGILKIDDKIIDGSIRKDLEDWKNTKS